ncbi:MAG: hypothetical protein JXR84_08525 [Anaerolineae bacterium]|nr:hypothetical protein [Anaerolineae bacterium]
MSIDVVYKIIGTAERAFVTYQNKDGGTEQTEVDIPWEEKLSSVRDWAFLYVSAQAKGNNGSVTCEIWVDGKKWKSNTSSGAYVIATCCGSAER